MLDGTGSVGSFALNLCKCMHVCRAMCVVNIFTASQQDKEVSDKKKKRQKSSISLNQLKYSYDIINVVLLLTL